MNPAMKQSEQALFKSVLRCADNYVEFGAGGSTVVAASLVRKSIVTIESSQEWLDKVAAHCQELLADKRLTLVHVNIGATRKLGYPADNSSRALWPDYHVSPWEQMPSLTTADTYLVDGRFRVACFMQVLLRCTPQAIVMIHDFANRPEYHIVHEFAREIAVADNLSVFQRRADFDRTRALACLEKFRFEPK